MEKVLVRIERWLKRTGMSRTRFGRDVLNDPKLVEELRRGRQLRSGTRARVIAWLDAAEAAR